MTSTDIMVNILFLHVLGDYFFQSSWMAVNKVNKWWPAFMHAFIYTIPFWFLTQSVVAINFILLTHLLIDRFSLARFIIIGKDCIFSGFGKVDLNERLSVNNFGFSKDTPQHIAFVCYLIIDNSMHIYLNYFSITHL